VAGLFQHLEDCDPRDCDDSALDAQMQRLVDHAQRLVSLLDQVQQEAEPSSKAQAQESRSRPVRTG
jgi:hypothetical protein